MTMPINRRSFTSLLLASAAVGSHPARAEDFPSRPLRIIIPLAPGSTGDVVTRTLADLLGRELQQSVLVDNRPGGEAVIATQAMLNAPADGYTMVMISSAAMVLNPLLMQNLPYDVNAIRPLACMTRGAAAYVVGPNSRFNTFEDMMAEARKQPAKVSLGVYAPTYRYSAIDLSKQAGVEFNIALYKSFPQVMNDLMGNTLDMALVDAGATVAQVAGGKLRALAVTAKQRLSRLPSVLTVREQGFPKYDLMPWIGLGVRSNTTETVYRRLEAALVKVLASNDYRTVIEKQGSLEHETSDGASLAALIAEEVTRFRALNISAGT